MKKILFFSLILCYTSLLYAQKGLFKKGIMTMDAASDTLNISTAMDLLMVDVSINNKVYKFILDSGAPTTISSNVVGDFSHVITEDLYDAYGNVKPVDYKAIPELKIGNATFKNIVAVEHDVQLFKDLKVDGFIGANILAKCVWDIDLQNKRIILHKNLPAKDFPIPVKIKLEYTGAPLLPVKYFGKIKENIWIDFGFNGLFSLSNSVYKVLKQKELTGKELIGNGVFAKTAFGANVDTYFQTKLSLNTNSFAFNDFIADVDYDEESSFGSEILKYYRIALDTGRKRMYFKPYNKIPPAAFNTFGINVGKDDKKIFVDFLWEESPAKKAGVKLKDRILSINGIDLENKVIDRDIFDKVLHELANEETITLEINQAGNFVELHKIDLFQSNI